MENENKIFRETDTNNLQNYYQVNDEELVNAYIGKNADKLKKGFSWNTLIFGVLYVLYRKMWLLGLCWILINVGIKTMPVLLDINLPSITQLFKNFDWYEWWQIALVLLPYIINIIMAFLFKKTYSKIVTKKVERIKLENNEKTPDELIQICNKKGGTTKLPVIILILIYIGINIYGAYQSKRILDNLNQKVAEDTAYSIISSVELAYAEAFLATDKDVLIIEDIKKEYSGKGSTWNDDNTITLNNNIYDIVCNITVNSNNELVVKCDVNGKKINSEPLSMNLNNNSNNKEEQNKISYNIVTETVPNGIPLKKLYVNKKLVTFQGSDIEVTQLSDILIVEVSFASSTLYAVDKDANIIGVFVPENNDYYENLQKVVTRANYRDKYRIDGNDLYVTTDRLAQDPHYALCNRITIDDDIVMYEEKFTYLGNSKFSWPTVVNTITRKQYMQEHNISCSNNNDNNSEQNENIDVFPIKTGKTIKFYKRVNGYFHVDDYKNEKEISKYTCTSEECGYCNSYTVCSNISVLGNNLIALYDYDEGEKAYSSNGSYNPSKIILWDVSKGKEVARYNNIISAYRLDDNNGNAKYIILENKNNEINIYDLNGNHIKEVSDEQFVLKSYEGRWIDYASYLVENDMIVTIKNNKQGIKNITKGKTLINHNYDEVVLYDSFVVSRTDYYSLPELYAGKYFKARIGNKWSLYDIKTGEKVINNDYDKIYLLDEKTIAVYNDGYLSFVDYKGNNVSDDKIKILNLFGTMPKNPEGIRFEIGNSTVKISIADGTDNNNYTYYSYEYNLSTKKLTKLS